MSQAFERRSSEERWICADSDQKRGRYPAGEVDVARARMGGNAVLGILDGSRSAAFSLGADEAAHTPRLEIHVGLLLRGRGSDPLPITPAPPLGPSAVPNY
jgi:hypothetical protein